MPAGLAVMPVEHVAMPVEGRAVTQAVVMPADSAAAMRVDSVAEAMPVAAAATAVAVTGKVGDFRN
jgi:hypothetical protein